jgi:hypothetical protein
MFQILATEEVAGKSNWGFLGPNILFFFSLKTFNKHIYNVINQLKIPLNLSKTIKSIRK